MALLAALLPAVATPASAQPVQVATDAGRVEGVRAQGIVTFKGIPFAAPPVGELRWRPPQPPEPWDGVRGTTEFSPMAPQRFAAGLAQSEDCLYLNVWTPGTGGDPRPVMVWIHGGGFATGSASEPLYDGAALARQGVVLVSFNYRINVFGAFAHPLLTAESPHGASGNYGLLDQVAALEWVQRNIEAFGGSPDRVTIFGESAGGRSVSLLMASPLTAGLFHGAVAQSGALRGVSTPLAVRERQGERLADEVSCDGKDDVIACLREKSYDDLFEAGGIDSNPIVDGWVIPEDPRAVYAEGRQHDVPMIIGGNADEGTFGMVSRGNDVRTAGQYRAYVQELLGEDAEQALAMYPADHDGQVFEALTRFNTDRGVARHARQHARLTATTPSSTWVYHFARVSPHHGWTGLGATHTAELPYLFGNLQFAARNGNLATLEYADRNLSQAMMRYWTRFAATGDPNQEGLPPWPAYDNESETLLMLDGEIAAGGWRRAEGLDLLDRLFDDLER